MHHSQTRSSVAVEKGRRIWETDRPTDPHFHKVVICRGEMPYDDIHVMWVMRPRMFVIFKLLHFYQERASLSWAL